MSNERIDDIVTYNTPAPRVVRGGCCSIIVLCACELSDPVQSPPDVPGSCGAVRLLGDCPSVDK
ncbi:hypothetical protein KGM_213394 [Danaus plexippus plexippus]|uniref:Uncharacterized protein n=1 Tax=Danaus plexippus plexippus TaxID=278856 RepID=A0A212FGM7_DANPL|nr:hypothetical protein KGM_213394 [Danaus plexippus plexippus]